MTSDAVAFCYLLLFCYRLVLHNIVDWLLFLAFLALADWPFSARILRNNFDWLLPLLIFFEALETLPGVVSALPLSLLQCVCVCLYVVYVCVFPSCCV